jgi:hypothetical protein
MGTGCASSRVASLSVALTREAKRLRKKGSHAVTNCNVLGRAR